MRRILCVTALIALGLIGVHSSTPARADEDTVVLRARGNPNLVDFFALSGKQSSLRADITRQGLDAAFSEWLRRERPHLYRQYAAKMRPGGRTAACCRSHP